MELAALAAVMLFASGLTLTLADASASAEQTEVAASASLDEAPAIGTPAEPHAD